MSAFVLLSLNELQHSLREVTPVNGTIIHFIGRKLNFPVLWGLAKGITSFKFVINKTLHLAPDGLL